MAYKFADVQMTEDLEEYIHENREYSFQKGETVSLPLHTARRFVTKWEIAEWSKEPYPVKEEEYEDLLCRVRNREDVDEDVEYCQVEKSNGEVCGREKPCPYHDN